MVDGDVVLTTLRKVIREDRELCEELCSLELISNADKYLSLPTETSPELEKEEEKETVGKPKIRRRRERWMELDGMNRRMMLEDKIRLIKLLRETMESGGDIEEREELMEGIERVIEAGKERGDEEGRKAEREGTFLLWEIEKKKRGNEMKSRREIERERDEEKRKREEVERRETEEKRKKEEEVKKRQEVERKMEETERERRERKKDF